MHAQHVREAADALRRLAGDANLAAFSGTLGTAPFWSPQAVEQFAATATPLEAAMARLFLAGDSLPEAQAREAFGNGNVDALIAAGVLTAATGDGLASTHLLVSCCNRLILAAPPPGHHRFTAAAAPYCGPESLWFAQFLAGRGPYDSALDLCTGSALQAMLPQAKHVVAGDIDPAALDIAAFNVALNRRDGITLRRGNLFDAVDDTRFDLITANPPFLPGGPEQVLPACGDGGRQGDEILARILAGVADHLAPGGEALIYAEGFGDRAGPAILADLPDMNLSKAHSYTCWIGGTRNAQQSIFDLCRLWQMLGATEEQAWAHWREISAKLPVTHYHHVIWRVTEGAGTIAVRRMRAG